MKRREQSAEDYLESILMIKMAKGYVRSVDVANHLGFSKPSVSIAMKKLREAGFLLVEKDGGLILTDEGKRIAESVYDRHQIIAKALMRLGVSEQTAYEDSCRIEHDISDESFERVKAYLMRKQA